MQTLILSKDEILSGYDAVAELYPFVPPLSHWRAWEAAAYRRISIYGRILDVGCGDGRYFRLIWPRASHVVGVDLDLPTVELARASDVYVKVHAAPAHAIPEPSGGFDSAFANCSLEHMDHIEDVLAEIQRCLKPGGRLICSVVTNRFVDWSLLPKFVAEAGYEAAASQLQRQFHEFHHLVSPLPVEDWTTKFEAAGFVVETHVPILPRFNGGAWGLMDSIWHVVRAGGGELGEIIHPILASNPRFPAAFRQMLSGLLDLEEDWHDCSGAVFSVRKVR